MNKRSGADGISCVGILLLAVIMLSTTVGVSIGNNNSHNNGALANNPALGEPSPDAPAATATDLPADTPTPLPSDTPTMTPTSTSTSTPTNTPTTTPTDTPTTTPTNTPPPTNTPTITPTPTTPPLPTPTFGYSRTVKVPILMYHYISVPPEDADIYRIDLSVDPVEFRRQMAYLANNGYTTINLEDLSLAITGQQELPPKPIIITIDDGYLDNYTNAFPILQEYGLTATFFIITEFVDQGHPAYMNWDMIREMAAAGMRMEPHTRSHVDLRDRSWDFLVFQILGSQQTLEHHIGYKPRYLAYPGGRYDEQVIEVLKALDFWGAVTTMGGRWHGYNDRYEWKRVRVRFTTTLNDFIGLVQ